MIENLQARLAVILAAMPEDQPFPGLFLHPKHGVCDDDGCGVFDGPDLEDADAAVVIGHALGFLWRLWAARGDTAHLLEGPSGRVISVFARPRHDHDHPAQFPVLWVTAPTDLEALLMALEAELDLPVTGNHHLRAAAVR